MEKKKELNHNEKQSFLKNLPKEDIDKKCNVHISVSDYSELLRLQKSLISICSEAMYSMEGRTNLDVTPLDVYDVLGIVKDLISYTEDQIM
jgi:ferredoxin-like protein FixX